MKLLLTSLGMIALLIAVYLLTLKFYRKYAIPILVPVLTSTVILVSLFAITNISYDTFMLGGKWINALLGPAVVALALPLYKQRHLILKNALTILSGTLIASFTGMLSVGLISKLFHLETKLYLATIPKSLTTPVAIDIANLIGGNSTITVFAVICAGIAGIVIGPTLFKIFRIDSSVSRGLSLGSASHAMGTTKAAEYDEVAFSMGSVAMSLCAIIGAFLVPVIVWILH